MRARASGVGNVVILFGARTGRDGIHGASLLASAEFDPSSEAKRPTVQVGDPFTEKLLLEATLEISEGDLAIAHPGPRRRRAHQLERRDGVSRRGWGSRSISIRAAPRDVHERVRDPALRVAGANAAGRASRRPSPRVREVCTRWDLECAVVGKLTDDRRLRVRHDGREVVSLPTSLLDGVAGAGASHRRSSDRRHGGGAQAGRAPRRRRLRRCPAPARRARPTCARGAGSTSSSITTSAA